MIELASLCHFQCLNWTSAAPESHYYGARRVACFQSAQLSYLTQVFKDHRNSVSLHRRILKFILQMIELASLCHFQCLNWASAASQSHYYGARRVACFQSAQLSYLTQVFKDHRNSVSLHRRSLKLILEMIELASHCHFPCLNWASAASGGMTRVPNMSLRKKFYDF